MYLPHLLYGVRAVLDFVLSCKLVRPNSASYAVLVHQVGTLPTGFLQIPPRDGHPCPWLMVPTAKPIADFHRQAIAHAGRTRKKMAYQSHFLGVKVLLP